MLFFSTWLVGKHPIFTGSFILFRDWARAQQDVDVYIKLHPLEDPKYVNGLIEGCPNIQVLDKKVGMKEALEPVSLIITTISNASIESAMLHRPTVVVSNVPYDPNSPSRFESDNYLHLEQFFPKRCATPEALGATVQEVFANYDHYLSRCAAFVEHHMSSGNNATERYVEVLSSIHAGREDFEYTELPEILDYANYRGELMR